MTIWHTLPLTLPPTLPYDATTYDKPMNLKEKKELVKKLQDAYNTCMDCGRTYGVYSVGCSSVYESKCDVCGETKPITETRDFAYFITGIRKLKLEIENESNGA